MCCWRGIFKIKWEGVTNEEVGERTRGKDEIREKHVEITGGYFIGSVEEKEAKKDSSVEYIFPR